MGRGPARSSLPKFLSVIAIAAAIALPQYGHDIAPGPPQTQPILLTNADIHTAYPGLITELETSNRSVYPGLSANSTIGLVEINAVRATRDYQETGKTNANARSYTAINPDTEIIPVTRANGVLNATTWRQTLRRNFTIVNLDGWTIEEMALEADAGIHIRWPGAAQRTRIPTPFLQPRQSGREISKAYPGT